MNPRNRAYRAQPHRQRGIVLFVALIVVVVMALAGLAMMRQTGSGISIAGNVSLRQNATSAGDFGTEAGRQWLLDKALAAPVDLHADDAANGYYATWGTNLDGDPTKIATWTPGANAVEATPADATQNRILYVIHRLCESLGAPDAIGQKCADYQSNQGGSQGGTGANYPGGQLEAARPLYRISARVEGPRNTLSFIQIMIQ